LGYAYDAAGQRIEKTRAGAASVPETPFRGPLRRGQAHEPDHPGAQHRCASNSPAASTTITRTVDGTAVVERFA
jgi:hypothetical protein